MRYKIMNFDQKDKKDKKDNKIENTEETTLKKNYEYESFDSYIISLWHRRNRMQCFTN